MGIFRQSVIQIGDLIYYYYYYYYYYYCCCCYYHHNGPSTKRIIPSILVNRYEFEYHLAGTDLHIDIHMVI